MVLQRRILHIGRLKTAIAQCLRARSVPVRQVIHGDSRESGSEGGSHTGGGPPSANTRRGLHLRPRPGGRLSEAMSEMCCLGRVLNVPGTRVKFN